MRRPLDLLGRCVEVLTRCGGWLAAAALSGRDWACDPQAAAELRQVLVSLGPSFVKIGQMLASRVDLLPATYITELRRLTDRVDPFPREAAEDLLEAEWSSLGPGPAALDAVFRDGGLPEEPVAAASLGQVYRLELAGLGPVAVKVQRPGIRAQICSDLYLLRLMAGIGRAWLRLNTDLVALVDEYGGRLIDELDFRLEARSAVEFEAAAAQLGLDSVCTVAEPVMDLTTRQVLVSAWIDGEHLESVATRDPPEARRLQTVALTAYLSMLLETGNLHADPHTGNLLRARDGRLAILDWGMVTRIAEPLRRSLLTYIVHVLAKDYEAVPEDLVALGFISQAKRDTMGEVEVAQRISEIFRSLASGGSARRRVADVLPRLAQIRQRHGSIGQIPPSFVYILRTFSILEGSGLRLDKDYRIVEDCYPYLASWAARANGPEARPLLYAVLYGAKVPGKPAVPDAGQMLALLRGVLASLRRASLSVAATAADDRAAARAVAKQLRTWLQQLAGAQVLREVALEEAARAVDVLLREALEAVVGVVPGAAAAAGVPRRTEEDRAVLAALLELAALASESFAQGPTPDVPEAVLQEARRVLRGWWQLDPADARVLAEALAEAWPAIVPTVVRFGSLLMKRAAQRVGTAEVVAEVVDSGSARRTF